MIYDDLSPREKEVLKLVCKGFTDAEIAKILGIKLSTVKTFFKFICEKYNVSTSVRRVRLVLKRFKELNFINSGEC